MDIIQQTQSKRCTKCYQEKPLSEYYWRPMKGRHEDRCKSCNREAARKYYYSHREKALEAGARYRACNREKVRERKRIYASRPEARAKIKERMRRWVQENQDKIRKYRKKRAERIKNGSLQPKQYAPSAPRCALEHWDLLCRHLGNRCLRCGKHTAITMDHVIPLAIGGLHHITNVQPLCKKCNIEKYLDIIDYRDPKILKEFLVGLQNK